MVTKTGRISVARPKPRKLPPGDVYFTASSTRIGLMHYTFFLEGKDPFCTCEGYTFNDKCRHIEDIHGT